MAKISVLGAGSWGTALSILLYNNGHEVILWSALGEEITTLREKREHVSKLPGVKIPEPVSYTHLFLTVEYHNVDIPCRFDVAGIDGDEIHWVKNAFEYIAIL